MELRNLNTFIRVADYNSFSKAAASLGYTQSTVTTQIQRLEEELGVPLFDRIGRTIRLTEKGVALLSYAREISEKADTARRLVQEDTEPGGELRIGIFESLCGVYLLRLLNVFHRDCPGVKVRIQTGPAQQLGELLNANRVDLIWILDHPAEPREWVRTFRQPHRLTAVCAPGHPLAGERDLPPERLAEENFLFTEQGCGYRRMLEDYLHGRGVAPNVFLEIDNMDIIKRFVEVGFGLGFLPDFIVEPELESGRLSELSLEGFRPGMDMQIYRHRDKWLSPALRRFLRTAGEVLGAARPRTEDGSPGLRL